MEKFDVIVIGGGPGGYLAAERSADAGLKTMVVEKNEVGGVCLNEGCIPTKTFLYAAKLLKYAENKGEDWGVKTEKVIFNHSQALEKKREVISTLVSGVKSALRKKKVKIVYDEATVDKNSDGYIIKCSDETYFGKNLILATGSEPVIPPIEGLKENLDVGNVLNSRELLELDFVPDKLVVIGAGVIGLEMASYFCSVGSKVVVVEMMDTIGGNIDVDAEAVLKKSLASLGIEFYCGYSVKKIMQDRVVFANDDGEKEVEYSKILLCTGRRPMSKIRGLEKIGVELEKNAIKTDCYMKTSAPNVYAIGDVNGRYLLAHVAYREAEVAVSNIAGEADIMDYLAIPSVIYTTPEVAQAGVGLVEARKQGLKIKEKKVSINMSGRHIAENGMSEGFIKLLIDIDKNIIIGATVVSAYASEIIYSLALMIQNHIPVEAIKKTVIPHPTVCEVIKDALNS